EDQRRVEKAALYPQIDAVASYGYTKQTPETLISTDGKFDQVGVEMNWNLFNGGRTRTSIKKASVELNKAQPSCQSSRNNRSITSSAA
ncbi:TolC family protein, partial [Klebsiella pneumoniae]